MGEKVSATFNGRVGVVQRVIPEYRVPFFDELALACSGGVEVFAGEPAPGEGIQTKTDFRQAVLTPAENIHFLRGQYYFCWQRGLVDWLNSFLPDVLIVDVNPRLLSTRSGIRFMKGQGRPVIGWGLGLLDWSVPTWIDQIRQSFLQRSYRHFDAVIGYGTKAAEDYNRLGIDKSQIFVARNAVSGDAAERVFQKIRGDSKMIFEWKKQHGLSDGPIVLSVGRLLEQKRVDDLIRTCANMKEACNLVIVGDGPERAALEALAKDILPKTVFLGHQTGDALGLCFVASDLFVLPGLGGLAIQEAMIYGKPVIVASGDGTQSDLVNEGDNGFFIEPGDIARLTELISFSLADPDRLRRMGAESRRIVEEEHNLKRMAQDFVTAIHFSRGQR